MIDPFTALALAQGAVAAVKKGCQLYKDIKSTAGEVQGIAKELAEFMGAGKQEQSVSDLSTVVTHKKKQKAAPVEIEISEHQLFTEITKKLGEFIRQVEIITQIHNALELEAKQVYTGEESVGERALKRITVRMQLEQMWVELREEMIYHAPPELKDLWGQFNEMWERIKVEQAEALATEERQRREAEARRWQRIRELKDRAWYVAAGVLLLIEFWALMGVVHFQRIKWDSSYPW